jgi:hypothetical protein
MEIDTSVTFGSQLVWPQAASSARVQPSRIV